MPREMERPSRRLCSAGAVALSEGLAVFRVEGRLLARRLFGWAAFLGVPDTRRTLRPISGLPDFLTSPSPLT